MGGGGGELGEGRGKWGQFTSNLRPGWTIPVTARRVPSKSKGIQRGDKGDPARGEQKASGNCAMYICNCAVCIME
jgi:hypothetical protein